MPTKYKVLVVCTCVIALVLCSVAATVALAAASTSDNIIYAAYNKVNGLLRIINDPSEVRSNEAVISWNKEGPPGPQGPSGTTQPKIAFCAYWNGVPVPGQVIQPYTNTVVDFGSSLNDGGGWDDNTNKFTAPQMGVYQFNISLHYKPNVSDSFLGIFLCTRDGYYLYASTVQANGQGVVTLSMTYAAASGQTFWVEVCPYSTGTIIIEPSSSIFSGHLVYAY